MAGRKTTEARKAKYKGQPIRTETNRQRKLRKHVKRYPNDGQTAAKLVTV